MDKILLSGLMIVGVADSGRTGRLGLYTTRRRLTLTTVIQLSTLPQITTTIRTRPTSLPESLPSPLSLRTEDHNANRNTHPLSANVGSYHQRKTDTLRITENELTTNTQITF